MPQSMGKVNRRSDFCALFFVKAAAAVMHWLLCYIIILYKKKKDPPEFGRILIYANLFANIKLVYIGGEEQLAEDVFV